MDQIEVNGVLPLQANCSSVFGLNLITADVFSSSKTSYWVKYDEGSLVWQRG